MADEKLRIILEAEADKALGPLKQVGEQLNKTGAAAGKFNRSLAGTNTTLTNFGRVLQDAPFGLIGIANNIDPLLSSFQQLKRESGSTGGALKALAAGLTGPAGIAIAVSAVTSAFIAFGPEIAEFFQTVDVAAENAAKATKNFSDAANQIAGEASKVETLVAVLRDETTERGRKVAAIKELNSISPTYFKGLTIEGDNVIGLNTAYKAYVGSLLAAAKAKAAQSAITDLYTKRLELEKKLVGTDLESANKKAAQATEDLNKARGSVRQLGIGPVLSKDEQAALLLQAQISELDRQIQQYAAAAAPAFDKVTDATDRNVKKNKEVIEDSFVELKLTQQITERTDDLTEALKRLRAEREKQDFDAQARIVDSVVSGNQLAPLDLAKSLTLPSGISEQLAAFNEQLLVADIKAANITTAFGLLTPAIDQAFAAIANGQNAFDAIGQALKRLIVDLVKAAALAAVLAAVTGGTGAGFGGAFLSQFKSLLGFRANGGPVAGPTIVGERGPELFVPNTSGSIVSNTNLRSGDGGGTLTARIAGNDLLILLDRAQRQRRRLGG